MMHGNIPIRKYLTLDAWPVPDYMGGQVQVWRECESACDGSRGFLKPKAQEGCAQADGVDNGIDLIAHHWDGDFRATFNESIYKKGKKNTPAFSLEFQNLRSRMDQKTQKVPAERSGALGTISMAFFH